MIIDQLVRLILLPPVFTIIVFPGLIAVLVVIVFLIWLERKIAAKVQLRYGPLYILKPLGGVIQTVADLLRYLFAEVIIPRRADKFSFIMAPILSFGFAFIPIAALPISSRYFAFRSDLSLLIVLALLTIAPIFILIIGWASDNKFSFIGSLREGYMIMAYEVPLFLSVLAMAILYNTLDIIEIVEAQSKGVWGIILNPFAAFTFLICTFMMTARFPFEISEAEQEIVMGPFTEYSGIIFGLCMSYSYIKLYILSLLFAYLFLGGWYPIVWPLTLNPIMPGIITLIKGLIIMILGIFLRSVYPRFRIDQTLRIGWEGMFTLSIASLILSFALINLGLVR
ncbi:MAG: NADH-quinone oxidoreductase subunit NuoH [Nitrososphaerales archaeon]|nr:NADH-quinone oxidoreductase subunit NuoH [Nitrososphaerales archaeon]